jgi:hypothetical protein
MSNANELVKNRREIALCNQGKGFIRIFPQQKPAQIGLGHLECAPSMILSNSSD